MGLMVEGFGAWGSAFRSHFAQLCDLAQSFDISASDHEYAAAFRGMIHSHILMPRYQQDTLMRSGFSRFWQCRFATTLQIGNAQMIDRWLRRQHDGSTSTPPPEGV